MIEAVIPSLRATTRVSSFRHDSFTAEISRNRVGETKSLVTIQSPHRDRSGSPAHEPHGDMPDQAAASLVSRKCGTACADQAENQEANNMDREYPRPAYPRWLKPMNKVFIALQRRGLHLGGMYFLTIVGRRSGKPRTTPVAPMTLNGQRYVLGGIPGSNWVANARSAGEGILSRGRRSERVRLVELPTEEAGPILREYPAKVPTGVSMMIKLGVVENGTPEYATLADRLPIFRIEQLGCGTGSGKESSERNDHLPGNDR